MTEERTGCSSRISNHKAGSKLKSLLKQQGKNVAAMRAEVSEENRKRQLTMVLELTFWDEFGVTRTLPPRGHYFDFTRWAWIPSLGEHPDV